MLAERHEEAAGSTDGGTAGAAGNSPYTPRMACTKMTLRKVLDSQIENCIEAWRQQRLLAVSGGAESSESVTAQYSQYEHGFVLILGIVDTTLQPRCERPECMRLAVVPPEAAAYHVAQNGGAGPLEMAR